MPYMNQRKSRSHLHKVKRLNHTYRHDDQISNFPRSILEENFLNKPVKYVKYLHYPLPELLADHSTDPLQNTTRQYIDTSSNNLNEGRFANHEMIIRRKGETTFLRPKQDLVLANGFTPVIRPSSLLPSYQSIMSHSQVSSSLSIMNKMSIKKQPEQTSIIKTKRKDRHRTKRCNENFIEQNNLQDYNFSNELNLNTPRESTFINFFKQALHEMIEEKEYHPPQPLPLMSILPEFHSPPNNYYNQSFTPRLEETYFNRHTIQSANFNEPNFMPPLDLVANDRYDECSYDFPSEQYHPSHFDVPQHQHVCVNSSMSHYRNYAHMPGSFF